MTKPPYVIPSMEEVRAIPWNGLTVASTFSGAGGSCTGYRMAGYRVAWANEFLPMAQESYKANADPGCTLDRRDIKQVQPEDILRACSLKSGELDLFDGSPPCQAFSTAGKRDKGWGSDKTYENGSKQKNEELFTEYIRLLRGLQPKTFVAENVRGLVQGKAKGFFLEILSDLKACGYRVTCRVLDAKWLGVPQSRTRTIFVGVRNDLNMDPVHPSPLPYFYSVRDALPHIGHMDYRRGEVGKDSKWQPYNHDFNVDHEVSSTNGAGDTTLRVIESRLVHPSGFNEGTVRSVEDPSPAIMAGGMAGSGIGQTLLETEYDEVIVGNNKFKPVFGPSGLAPSPTLMAGGPHGGSGEVRNSRTLERRKLTIDEAKALCAFPADFILKGTYAQQWERLGNSVPPLMARAIGSEIRDKILLPLKQRA